MFQFLISTFNLWKLPSKSENIKHFWWFRKIKEINWMKDKFLTVCSCHVTYAFQGESTFYSCLNVKELLAWSRRKIWSLSDCNWTRTHNRLVRKRTLNHLAKLAKWLSVRLRTKWLWIQVQFQSQRPLVRKNFLVLAMLFWKHFHG